MESSGPQSAARRGPRWTSWQERLTEAALSDYWAQLPSSGSDRLRDIVRHPSKHVAAVAAITRLPRREARLSSNPDGVLIHEALTSRAVLGTPKGLTGVCVLDVPADPVQYSLGSSKQTLRRKARSASKHGISFRSVDDPAERRALLDLALEAERQHPDERHRVEEPDLEALLDIPMWLAAYSSGGVPILLSVTPVDGTWSLLRYFRTLGTSPVHSDSRYLMTQVLVEALSRRGVRQLVDTQHPIALKNGLRHFQRMVGFRLVRVAAHPLAVQAPRPSRLAQDEAVLQEA